LRFHDRVDAGNILADRLSKSPSLDRRDRAKTIVLGIPRGGVIIADILAAKLSSDFDIVIGRKLRAPENPELAVGAVMEDGTSYLNEYLIKALKLSQDYLESEKAVQVAEIKRRTSLYRGKRDYQLKNRIVILTDDGIATGATVIAAARWIRKEDPEFLMIAVPVAPPPSVDILRREADAVEVILCPEGLTSVGQFYEIFQPTSDEEVRQIMAKRNL
jgi:putative phosphoribosyl transferase